MNEFKFRDEMGRWFKTKEDMELAKQNYNPIPEPQSLFPKNVGESYKQERERLFPPGKRLAAINKLTKIANKLDLADLYTEAEMIDKIIDQSD